MVAAGLLDDLEKFKEIQDLKYIRIPFSFLLQTITLNLKIQVVRLNN
jgi:hypothetical protein